MDRGHGHAAKAARAERAGPHHDGVAVQIIPGREVRLRGRRVHDETVEGRRLVQVAGERSRDTHDVRRTAGVDPAIAARDAQRAIARREVRRGSDVIRNHIQNHLAQFVAEDKLGFVAAEQVVEGVPVGIAHGVGAVGVVDDVAVLEIGHLDVAIGQHLGEQAADLGVGPADGHAHLLRQRPAGLEEHARARGQRGNGARHEVITGVAGRPVVVRDDDVGQADRADIRHPVAVGDRATGEDGKPVRTLDDQNPGRVGVNQSRVHGEIGLIRRQRDAGRESGRDIRITVPVVGAHVARSKERAGRSDEPDPVVAGGQPGEQVLPVGVGVSDREQIGRAIKQAHFHVLDAWLAGILAAIGIGIVPHEVPERGRRPGDDADAGIGGGRHAVRAEGGDRGGEVGDALVAEDRSHTPFARRVVLIADGRAAETARSERIPMDQDLVDHAILPLRTEWTVRGRRVDREVREVVQERRLVQVVRE